jgi:hypothetical protein
VEWKSRKVVKSWLGSQVIERHKARLSGNPSATLTTLSLPFDIALLIFDGHLVKEKKVSCCSSENSYSNLIGPRRWDGQTLHCIQGN